jgi:hypothetical protein
MTYGGVEVYSIFLTSVLNGVSGQLHAPPALSPGEETLGTFSLGGRVSPWAGLDAVKMRKISRPCRKSNPDSSTVQPIARHYTWAITCPKSNVRDRSVVADLALCRVGVISRLPGNKRAPTDRVSIAPYNRLSISSLNWKKACSPYPSSLTAFFLIIARA